MVDGGNGDDVIHAHSGSVVTGGRGNDTIVVRADSIVRFEAGDGQDTIHTGTDTSIQFGQGMTAERTKVEVSGNIATVRFDSSDDALTLHLRPGSPASLTFADGTSLSVAGEPTRVGIELSTGLTLP